jgi:hypothetical protein
LDPAPPAYEPSPADAAWATATFNQAEPPPASFAEAVAREAASYRRQGTPTAAFIAMHLERLGQLVSWTGAATPTEYEERIEIWEADIRQRWFDRGFNEGVEAARRAMSPPWPE